MMHDETGVRERRVCLLFVLMMVFEVQYEDRIVIIVIIPIRCLQAFRHRLYPK